MSQNTSACIFIEKLLQFCLEKRGIPWQPALCDSHVEDDVMLFDRTIGNAVLSTSFIFQARIRTCSRKVLDYIYHLPDPVEFYVLHQIIFDVALEIYDSKHDNTIQNTYAFLAVMVDVSVQCANNGIQGLIEDFVSIIPNVLNSRMPNGFLQDFKGFAMYAENLMTDDSLDEWHV